jgi:hypothetical protein
MFASSNTVLLHATFGLPHPWPPCGFQSKAMTSFMGIANSMMMLYTS